jgi:hypothetical protein
MVACNDYIILDTMIYRILQVREGMGKRQRESLSATSFHPSILIPHLSLSIFHP